MTDNNNNNVVPTTNTNVPFNGSAVGNNSQMSMLSNIQLGVSDITSIATAQQERILKEALDGALKLVREAESKLTTARRAREDFLTTSLDEVRRITKGAFTNLYLNGQYVGITDKTADITEVYCESRTNNIGERVYTAIVKAMYNSRTTKISWSEEFTHPYPTAEVRKLDDTITQAETNLNALNRDATRIRHQLADLPALERQAKAALAGAVLQSQGTSGQLLLNAVQDKDKVKALPPVN